MGSYMEIFEAISKPIYHIPYTVQRKKYNPNFSFFLNEIKELPSA
jgi:hypothetical protein